MNSNYAAGSGADMKAAVYQQYGSAKNIRIASVPKPVPKENEVLVRVCAASVNAYDWHLLRAKPFFTRFAAGPVRPRNQILGADIAGVVEASGGAALFQPGDKVFGCLESCGKGGLAAGGFAEYVCAKETVLAPMFPGQPFDEAAALPMAAVTALQGLRDSGQLKPGQSVLINGSSGGVGTFAVQIAKTLGAEVTAVCSPGGAETARALGADYVIDYTRENFSENGNRYDLIFDIAANHSAAEYHRSLNPGGVCVVAGFSSMRHMLGVALASKRGGKKLVQLMANNTRPDDLLSLSALVRDGKLKPVIDSRYPLEEAAKAISHVETGHPRGKVIIAVLPPRGM